MSKKIESSESIPREVAELIKRSRVGAVQVGLFGSHLEGRATSKSDYDLFVLLGGDLSAESLSVASRVINDLLAKKGFNIDSRNGGLHIGVYRNLDEWKLQFSPSKQIPEFILL